MKLIISLFVMLFATSLFASDIKILGFKKNEVGNYEYTDCYLSLGISSYTECSSRLDNSSSLTTSYFMQFPVVEYNDTRINFGVVVPNIEMRRTRPEFSVSYSLRQFVRTWFNPPAWVPFEAGVYVAMSPWQAFGVQLPLVRVNF